MIVQCCNVGTVLTQHTVPVPAHRACELLFARTKLPCCCAMLVLGRCSMHQKQSGLLPTQETTPVGGHSTAPYGTGTGAQAQEREFFEQRACMLHTHYRFCAQAQTQKHDYAYIYGFGAYYIYRYTGLKAL